MKNVERPILFSAPLVRAILAGRKTETRRLVTKSTSRMVPETRAAWGELDWSTAAVNRLVNGNESGLLVPGADTMTHGVAAKVRAGDTLWVRESFNPHYFGTKMPAYRADWDGRAADVVPVPRWTPSIHMPRWASRIDLVVKAVRVERLQEITGAGVLAEGVDNGASNPAMGKRWENQQRMAFERLWDSINGKRDGASWAANPWVWVIGFELERVQSSQP